MDWNTLLCNTRVRDAREGLVPERDPLEERSEFERDYDRAVFSTPVRRLQDKTQVFPLEAHDFIRTRLTHSLEVSTLARGMARRVGCILAKDNILQPEQLRDIEAIAATAALIHDLGNPPFGHSGEFAIREWFKKLEVIDSSLPTSSRRLTSLSDDQRADFSTFESNAQTLRLVARLQVLVDDYGLNLTLGTLSACMKYTASARLADPDHAHHEKSKPGYFSSEADLVDLVRTKTGTGDARNPITYLVEAADDLCYATVDFEDGIKKGIATWPDAEEKLMIASSKLGCEESMKHLIERAVEYISKAKPPLTGKARGEAIAQILRTYVIGKASADICKEFVSRLHSILAGQFHQDLISTCNSAPIIKAFKSVDAELFYPADGNLRLELMGRRILLDLLDCFLEGARAFETSAPKTKHFPGKAYRLMSANYRNVFEKALTTGTPTEYSRLQLVTDHVCGMTDTFACSLHSQLTNG